MARGVPSGYVEGLNDARTTLAGFFSILLEPLHWSRTDEEDIDSGSSSVITCDQN